jgi:long-chain acyl-CoA synthetase
VASRPHRISPEDAVTLDGLFRERVRRSPNRLAYRYFDDVTQSWRSITWAEAGVEILRWQTALRNEGLLPGDRVAIMLKNCPDWIIFDQAALGLGLITVPLYTSDRPDNAGYVLQDAGVQLLVCAHAESWLAIRRTLANPFLMRRIVTVAPPPESTPDIRIVGLDDWLPQTGDDIESVEPDADRLASIVYTSGTTGRPKGVMLSHRNILRNGWDSLQTFDVQPDDQFFSFLPLSHMLERTVGYYIPIMADASVGFARSFQQLQEDFSILRPTLLVSVPRIYERIYAGLRNRLKKGSPLQRRMFALAVDIGYRRFEHRQGRASWHPSFLLWPVLHQLVAKKLIDRLGGRLRKALSGGAALSPEVARIFIALGLEILQGYGLTEASPVVSVNLDHNNRPATVGPPIPGVEVNQDEDGALLVRGPGVMQGYWQNEPATREVFTEDGWLKTGDITRIDEDGYITIVGRVKDIIVMSNGEKVPPGDLEAAILQDPLFDQVMIVGEGQPYLSALVVVNREEWEATPMARGETEPWPEALESKAGQQLALGRIARQIRDFPGYTRIRRVTLLAMPWTIENGLLTPTLKIKRNLVLARYQQEYQKLYDGYLSTSI